MGQANENYYIFLILLNDTKKQRKMGQNGKKFVKENFAWQIIAKEFKKTISEQLKL